MFEIRQYAIEHRGCFGAFAGSDQREAIAHKKIGFGIFRQNGLDAELIYIGGGPRSMAALLSGQLQVIGTGGIIQITDTGARALPKRFYRLDVLP